MRNRGELVSLIVKIQDVGPRLGYLKKALYTCKACGNREEISQRVARERKRPTGPCRVCLEDAQRALGGDIVQPYRRLEALLQLTAEGSFYQDIQYLNVHDAIEPDKQPIQILVDDEYVDRHKPGETIRINGVVYIDPIPDRNFVKDTRYSSSGIKHRRSLIWIEDVHKPLDLLQNVERWKTNLLQCLMQHPSSHRKGARFHP